MYLDNVPQGSHGDSSCVANCSQYNLMRAVRVKEFSGGFTRFHCNCPLATEVR